MAGQEAALPGTERPDSDRIVLHVDADCFFAACERLRDPSLNDEPLVIGMGYEDGDTAGAVATASYEARAFGVQSAQPISRAIERLPPRSHTDGDREETGVYRPVDMDYYKSVSADVAAIIDDCADVVRKVSIDEAYLDVTDRTDWSVAAGFARHVKDRIRREVGITVSIGVAPSMSVAKIASDFDKPDGLTVIPPEDVSSFLRDLPVEDLHGVGPVTATELRSMGLETAGDIAETNPADLRDRFGERGHEIYERASGRDDRAVEPVGRPKSFSRESSIDPDTAPSDRREVIQSLARDVAHRATHNDALYRTVGIKAVVEPYSINTRERSLPGPVDDVSVVESIALELFEEFQTDAIRKIGVRVANLSFTDSDQPDLETWEGAESSADSLHPEELSHADRTGQRSLDEYS